MWIFLLVLTGFFLLGYIFQILSEMYLLEIDENMLIAAVYFMGAVYVLSIVTLSGKSLSKLREEEAESEKLEEYGKKSKEYAAELERKVAERTSELSRKIEEMEKFEKLSVGRELKMRDLKKKIKEFEASGAGK